MARSIKKNNKKDKITELQNVRVKYIAKYFTININANRENLGKCYDCLLLTAEGLAKSFSRFWVIIDHKNVFNRRLLKTENNITVV